MKMYFSWPKMKDDIEKFVKNCHVCQINKQNRKKYGHLTGTTIELNINKFEVIAADIMGPLLISKDDGMEYSHILTIIDIKSRYIELIPLHNTLGPTVATAIDQVWLCRYPRPNIILTDNGKNFIGKEVNDLLLSYGIKHKYTTTYNLQCNSIIERSHSTINEYLRCLGIDQWHTKIQAIAWFMRSTFSKVLRATPGQVVFNRDNYKNDDKTIPSTTTVNTKAKDLERENKNRIAYNYKVDDLVLISNPRKNSKFVPTWFGPYPIVEATDEVNYVVIKRETDLLEKVNMRRVIPYFTSSGGQNVVSTSQNTEYVHPVNQQRVFTNVDIVFHEKATHNRPL